MVDRAEVRRAALERVAHDWDVDGRAVRLDRELALPGNVVMAMTVRENGGHRRGVLVGYAEDPDGTWRSTGGSSGRHRPPLEEPWTMWGGWGPAEPTGAAAVVGGWIADQGVTTATLTDPTDRTLRDTVENSVVLFVWSDDFEVRRATLSLSDGRGREVYRGPLHPSP